MATESISYKELNNSEIKMAVLLFGLSFPDKPTPEYWEKWMREPLHRYVFTIVKGLSTHRQRIFRLRHEQEHVRQQFQQISEQRLTPEEADQLQQFLQREYKNLLRAEKKELEKQLSFLDEQLKKIDTDLANLDAKHEKEWEDLLQEHLKIVKQELKQQGLSDQFNEIKAQIDKM